MVQLLVAKSHASSTIGLENVWLVGDEFKDIPCSYRKFQNVEEVKEALKANQPHDHYILIKGSNSVKLFQLPELL